MIEPWVSSESAPNVPDLVPSSAPTPTSGHYIPSLDGIRAVSFMLVFGAHAGLGAFLPADLGVTVFFFLSGFLITTLMRIEFEKNGSVNIRHFLLRRALRILPPFFAMMLIGTLIALTLYPPGAVRGSAVTAELLFYTNYWYIYGNSDFPPGTDVVLVRGSRRTFLSAISLAVHCHAEMAHAATTTGAATVGALRGDLGLAVRVLRGSARTQRSHLCRHRHPPGFDPIWVRSGGLEQSGFGQTRTAPTPVEIPAVACGSYRASIVYLV